MTLSRRKTLALIGGGAVLAASGGATAFAVTRTPHTALAPWDQAGAYDDPRLFALSYGILAPNPHNRQPWEVALDGGDGMVIYRNPDLNLPVTDLFARQLTVGMGCFLELTRMAAAERGYTMKTDLFPDGEDGPVARCRLVEGAAPDPLFAHVMDRRSHKEPFDARVVTAEAAAPLAQYAKLFLGGDQAERLREIANEAWLIEAATRDAWMESIDLMRIGKAQINAKPDGIDVGGPFLEALAAVGMFDQEVASDVSHPGTKNAIAETTTAIYSAPALVMITRAGNTRQDQIEAGTAWVRLNLAATGAGLGLRPVSQSLQEYPEVAGPYAAIHAEFAAPEETVQMLGLLGYAARTPRTPRWPLDAKRLDA